MPKIVLIDAHSYLHRAFHALPPLTTSKGEPVNAIYGFARMTLKLIAEQKPDYIAVCFDAPGPTFRAKIDPNYKATRKETDENLRSQFPLSRELARAFGLHSFELSGFEADDLIATLARLAAGEGMEVLAVSGDKDILQMVNGRIKVLSEPKQVLYDAAEVRRKWGVGPEQLGDVLALMGDASDNVPGVPGIGEKTAVKLIQEFGSIAGLLQNSEKLNGKVKDKILQNRELMEMSRKLVALEDRAPIEVRWEECRVRPPDPARVVPFLKKLEFHALVNDLFAKGLVAAPPEEREKFAGRYQTVLTEKQLEGLVRTLSGQEEFALDVETTGLNVQKARLVGISLAWKEGEAVYIPVGHAYLGAPEQLSIDKVLAALRPSLGDAKVRKIGHNLKFDISILAQAGVEVRGLYFDTMIASYCLDPLRASHRLKDLASEFLNRNMTRINELVPAGGRAAKEMAMDQAPVEKVSDYACADADCTLQLYAKLKPLLKEKKSESLFYDLEMPLVEILAGMERAGLRVDPDYLRGLGAEFEGEIRRVETEVHGLAGQEFNLSSSKQLAFVLFEKLKLTPVKKTKTGFSTDEEVLTALSAVHPLPKLLLRHRELSKLKSTYIDALLAEVDATDSRVHTSFNQAGTATGRLSSSDPNLQNIPIRSEDGRRIRRAFVPMEGCRFLSADYSQIDLRVLAHLSQDPVLCEGFRGGADIHRATAAEVFQTPLDQVSPEQRRRAKAINFGIVYGQQAFGLSQGLGITFAEAQETIDQYFKKYAGVKEWIEETKRKARQDGYVKTLLGRIRYLPEIGSKNGAMRSFAERTAVNTPVQGTSADIIKAAMIAIARRLSETRARSRMLLQVHDDLLLEVPEGELEAAEETVRREMESAVKLSVPLEVDLKTGRNWDGMQALKRTEARN